MVLLTILLSKPQKSLATSQHNIVPFKGSITKRIQLPTCKPPFAHSPFLLQGGEDKEYHNTEEPPITIKPASNTNNTPCLPQPEHPPPELRRWGHVPSREDRPRLLRTEAWRWFRGEIWGVEATGWKYPNPTKSPAKSAVSSPGSGYFTAPNTIFPWCSDCVIRGSMPKIRGRFRITWREWRSCRRSGRNLRSSLRIPGRRMTMTKRRMKTRTRGTREKGMTKRRMTSK
mmetsp:Transcript_27511/g.56648  ORF Transcript_27511/g.56648 Transcript_27511/m.56648 type:complete len:229 (-) Transcript_27511:213-899(-)